MPAGIAFTTVNISAPDPSALARFYAALLDWPVAADEPGWAVVRDPAGGVGIAFQPEEPYVAPVWPARDGEPQMQQHLEIRCTDLDAAVEHAVGRGATLAGFQPQDDVRVCLDPAGHPFCLWLER